ncbi:MAG: 2,3-dihydroxyphenylpropionate 1,2-dioxygenase [Actinobacteria bacterium]|nr:2,3-dihydroxyphenylpropionate 1,2-dioxygenase [Actinomycetota bacterium]
MANVVGTLSLSHSPLWNLAPDPAADEPGGTFVESVERARQILESLRPDAIVIFGPDHARGVFYDLLPPFTIGIERVEGVGDYNTPKGELPLASDLARTVFDGVTARGFDPAVSLDMRIDHGLTQAYSRLVPDLDIPIVPVIVNSGCPPLPSFARSFDFGAAVGEAIGESDGAERVLTIGSGGMSHWPASIDAYDTSITPEWREFLIHGRPLVDEVEPGRVARAKALADGHATGDVADRWDAALLDRISSDPMALRGLDDEDVVGLAGPGAGELRTWAAATAAWGGELAWTAYEPVPRWITGMGVVASAAPASAVV